MQWLALIGLMLALSWLAAALTALSATHAMVRHSALAAQRGRAATRARIANSAMLLCQCAMLLTGVLLFGRNDPLRTVTGELGQVLLASGLVAYMLLIVVTLALPDLPGRPLLRQVENALAVLLALLLGLLSVLGARYDASAPIPFGSAGALSLMFGFFVLARPYLRGGVIVLQRTLQQGTPGREATLKRLLRRYRPFIVANGVALAVGALLL